MLPMDHSFDYELEAMAGQNVSQGSFPAKVSLAMAYVPYQYFENLYDEMTGLERGTIFKSLDLPFVGGKQTKGCKLC